MAAFAIPLTQDSPWYAFNITLSDVTYNLEIRYNTRRDRWVLSIFDSTEQPIVVGIPLLIDRDVLAPYQSYTIPSGVIFAADNSNNQFQPTLSSFLTDHKLYYVDAS